MLQISKKIISQTQREAVFCGSSLMQIIEMHEIKNTSSLIAAYNTAQIPQIKQNLKEIINQLISEFFQKNILSPALVKEFALLSFCQDRDIVRTILEKLGESIEGSKIFKPNILNCLTSVLLTVNPEYFRGDQSILIQLGLILLKHLSSDTHFSKNTYAQVRDVFNVLQAISFVMVNSGVEKLEKNSLWPQFSERMRELSKHSYYPIQYKAKYISQSLARIKSDEGEITRKARKALSIVIGIIKVGSALYTQRYGRIIEGFEDLRDGFSQELEKKDWYWSVTTLNMMALCVITNPNYFGSFMGLIKGSEDRIKKNKEQVYGIAECLHSIALNSSEKIIKGECVSLLAIMYRDKKRWGKFQDIRKEILEMLLGLLGDNKTREAAANVLDELKRYFADKKKSSEGREIIEARIPEDLASVVMPAKLYPSLSSTIPSGELYEGVYIRLKRESVLQGLGDDKKEIRTQLKTMEESLRAVGESIDRQEAVKTQEEADRKLKEQSDQEVLKKHITKAEERIRLAKEKKRLLAIKRKELFKNQSELNGSGGVKKL